MFIIQLNLNKILTKMRCGLRQNIHLFCVHKSMKKKHINFSLPFLCRYPTSLSMCFVSPCIEPNQLLKHINVVQPQNKMFVKKLALQHKSNSTIKPLFHSMLRRLAFVIHVMWFGVAFIAQFLLYPFDVCMSKIKILSLVPLLCFPYFPSYFPSFFIIFLCFLVCSPSFFLYSYVFFGLLAMLL